jgi:hypothetical protein
VVECAAVIGEMNDRWFVGCGGKGGGKRDEEVHVCCEMSCMCEVHIE